MPWTLYRYIFKELIRLLVLSTSAPVLVIGFAVSIKPLMDGLLGPVGLVKLLLYTIPTVLGFAVPFSAAFSSTLVLCRMASDNEVQACRAVGLSYGTILLPAVFMGLALTLAMYYLGNWVVPSFYRSAEGMVQKNMVDMIVSQVQRGEPVEIPNSNMVLFANKASISTPERAPGEKYPPDRLIVFDGVAVGKVTPDGELRNDTTAQQAQVMLYRVEDDTWYKMLLKNVMFVENGQFGSSAMMPIEPERVPNPLKDRARFLSWTELRQILSRPERFDLIQGLKDKLVATMAAEQMLINIDADLSPGGRSQGKAKLLAADPGDQDQYVIQAPRTYRLGKEQVLVLAANGKTQVTVEHFMGGQIASRFVMPQAVIRVDSKDGEPEAELVMQDVTTFNARQKGPEGGRSELSFKGLRWSSALASELASQPALRLLSVAQQDYPDSPAVISWAQILGDQIDQLGRRLIATAFQRAASAVSCLLVLVLGAVLSIKLKNSLPLVIYFWIFMLAFLAMVITNSGEKLAQAPGRPLSMALSMVWSGDLFLLAALMLNYWQLTRT